MTADGTATVAGADYTATTGTVTFLPGVTSGSFTVATLDDSIDEVDETLTLAVTGVSGVVGDTSDTGIGTIVDDDDAPVVTVGDASVDEGGDLALATVTSDKLTVLARAEILTENAWTPPTLVDASNITTPSEGGTVRSVLPDGRIQATSMGPPALVVVDPTTGAFAVEEHPGEHDLVGDRSGRRGHRQHGQQREQERQKAEHAPDHILGNGLAGDLVPLDAEHAGIGGSFDHAGHGHVAGDIE